MTMLTVMTMFLIYPFTLSHEHRHHRHHRHAYSEMTLAVYYCSKQKQWCYEKCKIRMTQMTLMTLNLGYGIGISSKQRHERHLRHYRHRKKCAGGLGYTPEMCMWMTTCYASKTYSLPRREQSNWTPIQIRIYFRMNHFWFIQKSWLEKVNPFWFTFQKSCADTLTTVPHCGML